MLSRLNKAHINLKLRQVPLEKLSDNFIMLSSVMQQKGGLLSRHQVTLGALEGLSTWKLSTEHMLQMHHDMFGVIRFRFELHCTKLTFDRGGTATVLLLQ